MSFEEIVMNGLLLASLLVIGAFAAMMAFGVIVGIIDELRSRK